MCRKQRGRSGQRECGASEELKFGKAARVTGVADKAKLRRTLYVLFRSLQNENVLKDHAQECYRQLHFCKITDCRIEDELEGRISLKSEQPVERTLH